MKDRIIKRLNNHYYKYLHKEKYRNLLNRFLFRLWKIVFSFHRLLPIKKKTVLFVAANDKNIPPEYESLNSFAIENGYRTEFIFRFDSSSRVIYKNEWNKIRSDLKFQRLYARAKCTFVCDYYLPAYANNPRKKTKLIQIWHGCGAFKKWGYSTRDSSWGLKSEFFEKYNIHKTYSLITTSSEDIKEIYAEAFGSSVEKVKALGVPRTDIFFDKEFVSSQKDILLEKFPDLKNKKLVLYAPTYRGDNIKASRNDLMIDFANLKSTIGEDYAVLVKLHPHLSKGFSVKDLPEEMHGFVYDISNVFSISSALCFADMVVSDYSSLIFEYSLFERPMIFYAYDLESYDSDRSFYYNYEELVPGRIVKTTQELAKAILDAEADFDKARLLAFKSKFMSACDGDSTKRVFEEATR